MRARQKRRLALVAFVVVGVAAALGLTLNAFEQTMLFFMTPTQVAAGESSGRMVRLGGMVAAGSSERLGGVRSRFVVTDFAASVTVEYEGILPDLFREGQGVVVRGVYGGGVFEANEVLAKHDENYMPPEVYEALKAGQSAVEYGGGASNIN